MRQPPREPLSPLRSQPRPWLTLLLTGLAVAAVFPQLLEGLATLLPLSGWERGAPNRAPARTPGR